MTEFDFATASIVESVALVEQGAAALSRLCSASTP
jgi:hypothetical protein